MYEGIQEDIDLYQNSFVKKQLLWRWGKIRRRVQATYRIGGETRSQILAKAYDQLKPLLFRLYDEEFAPRPRNEINMHGCISHCAWMADHLGKKKEAVFWLEIQDFLILVEESGGMEKDEKGLVI